jgi:hypothetical protein
MSKFMSRAGKLIVVFAIVIVSTGVPVVKAATITVWPLSGTATTDLSKLASPFGPRWQTSQNRYDYHPGIDIAAPLGTPVHAIEAGTVTFAGWLSDDSGNSIIIYHPSLDLYTAYLHLNTIGVAKNQVVEQAQVIGGVGDSGATTFVHLHFEVRLTSNNYPLSTRNPLGYLPRTDTGAPGIQIVSITADPLESPTVTLLITTPRDETDLNQIRVVLKDSATKAVLDDQSVDFNLRLHTGTDVLEQDGIKLIPTHFNTSSTDYQLSAYFYTLHGQDAFTLTAYAVDIDGNSRSVEVSVPDTEPPGKISDLATRLKPDGSIDFTWTAPGDNIYNGTAAQYDLRFSQQPIDSTNWTTSTIKLGGLPLPDAMGQPQSWSIPGPVQTVGYYALKTADKEGNWSVISNVVRVARFVYLPTILGQ